MATCASEDVVQDVQRCAFSHMCDRRPRRRVYYAARVAAIAFSLTATGCLVPVAAWPRAAEGSGAEIRFVHRDGELIEHDGILIMCRPGIFGSFSPDTVRVLEIEKGRARLPRRIGWTVLVMGPVPFSIIVAPVYPHFWSIGDHFILVPLIPGYHCVPPDGVVVIRVEEGVRPVFYGSWREAKDDGALLVRNDDDPDRALEYWRVVRARLRRRYQARAYPDSPDIRLERLHFGRVAKLVDDEIHRLERLVSTSRPVNTEGFGAEYRIGEGERTSRRDP